MAERTERSVLNHLIETCRDAERGLLLAAEHVQSRELKRLFYRLAEQRRAFANELLPHAHRLGGASTADGTAAAAVHRGLRHPRAPAVQDRPLRSTAGLKVGTVVAFDPTRGYGRIAGPDGVEHDFHLTAIAGGSRTIEVGTTVAFDVVAGHLGRWEAARVHPLPT